jgi:hypothetical protein
MLGALQFYALRKEFVGKELLQAKDFHDAILHTSTIPVELIRVLLLDEPIDPDYKTHWRFYDALT